MWNLTASDQGVSFKAGEEEREKIGPLKHYSGP